MPYYYLNLSTCLVVSCALVEASPMWIFFGPRPDSGSDVCPWQMYLWQSFRAWYLAIVYRICVWSDIASFCHSLLLAAGCVEYTRLWQKCPRYNSQNGNAWIENPAYGRHWISRGVLGVAPMQNGWKRITSSWKRLKTVENGRKR